MSELTELNEPFSHVLNGIFDDVATRANIPPKDLSVVFGDLSRQLQLKTRLGSRGRGKSRKSIALISAAAEILREIQPATVRAVCYRLFIRGLIPSMSKNHTNAVSTQLVWAREQGAIEWDWIVDETREAERISTWNDPAEIIEAAVRGYRKNYWSTQPNWLEVWSEKGTVRGTLAPVLDKYGVTFRVMHGYGSATSLHSIAEETLRSEKPLEILYVGDWDPSGLHMSAIDLPNRLDRYGANAFIRRVALGEGDVTAGGLPSFEAESKRGDPRHQWFVKHYGLRCWELDALSPVHLRDRVEAEILCLLDTDAWDHAIKIETAERESMACILREWPTFSRQVQKFSPEAGA